ncbi:MAG: class F sortase [Propionibacterium sp.]|nr:class F sortase [Propionibacterium sp.]
MRHRITRIVGTITMLVFIAILALVAIRFVEQDTTEQSLLPEFLRTMGGSAIPGAGPESSDEVVDDCPAEPQEVVNPVRMTLIDQGMSMPVISLGLDATGAAPATPPGNEGYTVGWFNEGPLVGSQVGNVVLSAHTFRYGGALGNQLNNGLLTPGELIRISGSDGSSACYRHSGHAHVMVDEYDPTSNILYDDYGDPKFALIVCSDYDSDGLAQGRMIYYGTLVTGNPTESDG